MNKQLKEAITVGLVVLGSWIFCLLLFCALYTAYAFWLDAKGLDTAHQNEVKLMEKTNGGLGNVHPERRPK